MEPPMNTDRSTSQVGKRKREPQIRIDERRWEEEQGK